MIYPESFVFVAPGIAVRSTGFQRFFSFFSENARHPVRQAEDEPANGRKRGNLAREQLSPEACRLFTPDAICSSLMLSELNRRNNEAGSQAPSENFKGNASQLAADTGVRLSPLPARNTLLTILFFSALAAGILYWIFFPPAPPQASENSPASNAQPAERN